MFNKVVPLLRSQTRPSCFWNHTQVLWYSHSSRISTEIVLNLSLFFFFKLSFEVWHLGKTNMQFSCAPPCLFRQDQQLTNIYSLLCEPTNRWMPLQTAFLVVMPTGTNAVSLFPPASLGSMACRVCALQLLSSAVGGGTLAEKAHSHLDLDWCTVMGFTPNMASVFVSPTHPLLAVLHGLKNILKILTNDEVFLFPALQSLQKHN